MIQYPAKIIFNKEDSVYDVEFPDLPGCLTYGETLEKAKKIKNKPVCIIANTIKGKGVSFMENIRKWHGKAPNQQEYEIAIKEIEENNNEIK